MIAVAIAVLAAPFDAQAHLVTTRLGDFYDGAVHPLLGIEDLLPWLALAILTGFQGGRRARWLLPIFPAGLLIGGWIGTFGPDLGAVPIVDVALVALMGLAIATAITVPTPVLIGLAAIVSLAHGYQNGQAVSGVNDPLLFVLGVTAIGYVIVSLASAAIIAFLDGRGEWRSIAVRASGSWVAAIGVMALGFRLFVPGV